MTVSYNEAARLLDGGERVDAVPMPPEVLAWVTPFVAEHYKPEPDARCDATTRSPTTRRAATASGRAERRRRRPFAMSSEDPNPKGFSLRRWSQRKLQAAKPHPRRRP